MPKLTVLKQSGLPPTHPNHKHTLTTEHFVNRPDISFQKCTGCGDKFYPDGFVQVFGGSSTTILWPT